MNLGTRHPDDDPLPREMTLAEFWDCLDRFDWFYEMSDDHRVWQNGERAVQRILTFLAYHRETTGNPQYEQLYNGFTGHYYSGKPWNTPKQPKPERPT
jgi:hypothetical protein